MNKRKPPFKFEEDNLQAMEKALKLGDELLDYAESRGYTPVDFSNATLRLTAFTLSNLSSKDREKALQWLKENSEMAQRELEKEYNKEVKEAWKE